ncbi:SAM-dependent methyltransferase [Saccharopolyspora montiporae]
MHEGGPPAVERDPGAPRHAERPMDIDRPAAARIYDAFLGGGHNFGVERDFAEHLARDLPGVTEVYRENRAFLRRSVEHLLARGVRQFLDLGSGIPTIGPAHEVAARRSRDFRVLYVDNEPLTAAHSKPLLAGDPRVDMLRADLRDPDAVLGSAEAAQLLDLREPVALLATAALHFVPDGDRPAAILAAYRDALPAGSHLLLSHLTGSRAPTATNALCRHYAASSDPLFPRATGEIEGLFDGFPVLAPGLAYLADWRPDPEQRAGSGYRLLFGGLGRTR